MDSRIGDIRNAAILPGREGDQIRPVRGQPRVFHGAVSKIRLRLPSPDGIHEGRGFPPVQRELLLGGIAEYSEEKTLSGGAVGVKDRLDATSIKAVVKEIFDVQRENGRFGE